MYFKVFVCYLLSRKGRCLHLQEFLFVDIIVIVRHCIVYLNVNRKSVVNVVYLQYRMCNDFLPVVGVVPSAASGCRLKQPGRYRVGGGTGWRPSRCLPASYR